MSPKIYKGSHINWNSWGHFRFNGNFIINNTQILHYLKHFTPLHSKIPWRLPISFKIYFRGSLLIPTLYINQNWFHLIENKRLRHFVCVFQNLEALQLSWLKMRCWSTLIFLTLRYYSEYQDYKNTMKTIASRNCKMHI